MSTPSDSTPHPTGAGSLGVTGPPSTAPPSGTPAPPANVIPPGATVPADPPGDHAALCPSCGYQFGEWAGHPAAPVLPAVLTDHIAAGCPGRRHELCPDGRGWTVERPGWDDPGYWTSGGRRSP